MDKATFKKKLNELINETLDEQFDEDDNMLFSDFWETVRDRVDGAADDEDIESDDEDNDDEPVDDENED